MVSEKTQLPFIMILGCGRSGTSIFGELFDGLGPYVYRSEPDFAEVLDYSATQSTAVKVPIESLGFPADPGLSFPVKTMLDAQPSTMFFWIVRHPLDAISSLRIGIEKNWGHHPRPPDWEDWLERPLVDRCAYHWAFINEHGYDQVSEHVHLVRFEDMISNPTSFANNVCERVGLSVQENRATLDRWARRVQNTNNKHFIEAETSRDYSRLDHTKRVGRWVENLSAAEVQRAIQIVSSANERYGYDLGIES
jgi:hypothetical protein